MEIVLVRHGQPAWADQGVAFNDPGLTDLGHDQARRAADRLVADGGFDHLFVSTARRSRETVAPLIAATGRDAMVLPWLHEIRPPAAWDGQPAEEVGRWFQQMRHRPRDLWWEGIGEGAEPFRDFHDRVVRGATAALAEAGITPHPEDPDNLWSVPEDVGRVVVVAHAGTNSVLLGFLLGLQPQPWEWERFASAHASFTVLETTPIGPGTIFSLRSFSDVGHLSGLVITR
jgi:broad specificity phosphatase PhoE